MFEKNRLWAGALVVVAVLVVMLLVVPAPVAYAQDEAEEDEEAGEAEQENGPELTDLVADWLPGALSLLVFFGLVVSNGINRLKVQGSIPEGTAGRWSFIISGGLAVVTALVKYWGTEIDAANLQEWARVCGDVLGYVAATLVGIFGSANLLYRAQVAGGHLERLTD